ncbi:MAG: coproporphyrinogen III oxidase family protein, partial [Candidatus Marinimicrobia bacterium]|nr:coproporphyrinogen III oxidase family protein [Candidatus Neomarinimicrobiota bacterium]
MIKSGIYIHFPFCHAKCVYCDFYSVAHQEDLIPRFVNGLIREINDFVGLAGDFQFDTLFLGGGTPSLLTPDQLSAILAALNSRFGPKDWLEATIEANPGTVALEKLQAYRQLGINRISLGVQSFNPQNLTFLSRIHSADESRIAIEHSRTAGFDNLSCDLIFGLPGQTWSQWQQDLAAVVELGPEHLSCYNLTVEEQTPLYDLTSAGKIRMPDD